VDFRSGRNGQSYFKVAQRTIMFIELVEKEFLLFKNMQPQRKRMSLPEFDAKRHGLKKILASHQTNIEIG